MYVKHQEKIKHFNQTDGTTEGTTGKKTKNRFSREEKVKSVKKLSGTRGLVHSLHRLILLLHKIKLPQEKKNKD